MFYADEKVIIWVFVRLLWYTIVCCCYKANLLQFRSCTEDYKGITT